MTALDAEIRDVMSNLRGVSRRALNNNQPWEGTTALVVEGPAGVGKTFALTEAAKAMARELQANKTAKTIFSWDVMEIERGSADERLALLETLIFQAKQSSIGLRFHNYAFALAAYARRRRPGLKAP